jgi:hypothetical protein
MKLKIKKKKPLLNNTQREELFNNLYNEGKKRKEKYKKLSMEKEIKFNSIYTFTPKIINNKINNKYLKNMSYSILNNNNNNETNELTQDNVKFDFATRMAEYEKIKKDKLEKIKKEVDLSIKGNNNIKKRNINYYNKIPYNNLLNKSENYFENRQKNLEKIAHDMYEEQGITFIPKTNKLVNDKIKNDVIKRNNEFIKEKQERMSKYSNIKEKECTFKPQINNTKNTSVQSTINKTEQNVSNVSKRLFDYQNKYKEKLEEIKSKYKEDYTFKPEISKNTESIINNKKKFIEQLKDKDTIYNELILKQIKLGELEQLSKRINQLTNENKIFEEDKDMSSKEEINNINYEINSNKMNNNKINGDKKINKDISKELNSDNILELAKNIVNEDLNKQQQQNFNGSKSKESTNDIGTFLLNNNSNKIYNTEIKTPLFKSNNYSQEYDFDNTKGNKRIMNLNYYDSLLK